MRACLVMSFAGLIATPAMAGSWSPKPYVKPNIGVSIYGAGGSTSTAIGLGAQGGFKYFNEEDPPVPLGGRTRVSGTYLFSTDGGSGHDVRLGSFMGPSFKLASAELGLDVFNNGYSAGLASIPNTTGIDIPLNATLGPDVVYVLGGVTPAVLFNPARQVDWSTVDAFGFGHEFEWRLGVQLNIPVMSIGLTYSKRFMAPNIINQGFMLGVSVG